jgi:Outer membrane lipoprotein-sorting protein
MGRARVGVGALKQAIERRFAALRWGLACLALALPALASGPEAARAQTLTGRQIMDRVDNRNDGDRAVQDLNMLLIDQNGSTRTRRLRMWRRDLGKDVQSILFFLAPPDVEDTGLLTYDYEDPERDDDQWLYLPALKKTKRIATGDKSGSFMGSDFSYADMTERNLAHYDYTLLKEDVLDGVKVWQVEAIPNTPKEIDQTGYTKLIHTVRQDNDVMVGTVGWLQRGGRVKYFEVKKLEQIEGIWVPTKMEMTTRKGETTLHKTVLDLENVHFDQPMDESRFSVRQLEKGP